MFLNDVVIDNILVFKKISSSVRNYKYFVGYLDDWKSKPFILILPKTIAYIKSFDGGTKWMYC